MLKSMVVWKNIFTSPTEGFGGITNETKIAMPLVTIVILFIMAGALMLPVVSHDAYAKAMARASAVLVEKMGTTVTDEMLEVMEQQNKSIFIKVSTVLGPAINGLIVLLLSSVYLLIAMKIVRSDASFKLLFKLMVYLSIVPALALLLNYVFLLLSDWASALASVNNMADYSDVVTTSFSLAFFIPRETVGNQGYFILNFLTSIFNIIYYIFCFFGIQSVAKITKKSALVVTIILALGSMLIEMTSTLMM